MFEGLLPDFLLLLALPVIAAGVGMGLYVVMWALRLLVETTFGL